MNVPDDNRTATPSPGAGEGAGEVDMLDTVERLDICLIDPSYGIKEAQGITGVSAAAIRRWLSGYPAGIREMKGKWINYNDKWPDPLLVSFLELMEILVAGKFRAATGKSFAAMRKHNAILSSEWEAPFPFAHRNMLKQQDALPEPVVKTLEQMDYEKGYVSSWYPFGKDGALALDPYRASGQPAIKGRRLRVLDIKGHFIAGDSISSVAEGFEIDSLTVEAAIRFALLTAA